MNTQRGSLFTALFGAVALIGILAAGVNVVMRGPMMTMSEVTRRTVAENNMLTATRLAIVMAANNQPNNGDCDGDGFVEPIPFRDAAANPKPAGGGYIPSSIGATTIDPWKTEYGYCVWDHGPLTTTNNIIGCGGSSAKRLKGANAQKHITLAIISAGKDKTFQTTCNAFTDTNADGNPDTPLVNKPGGSDDIVITHTYAEANSVGNGLWFLKSSDPNTAEVGQRDIEITGSSGAGAATIGYDPSVGAAGVGNFMAVKTDDIYPKTASGPIELQGKIRPPLITDIPKPTGMPSQPGGGDEDEDDDDDDDDGGGPIIVPPASCPLPGGGTLANGQSKTMYSTSSSTNCASVSQSRTCNNGTLSGSSAYQYESCNKFAWFSGTWSACSASCGGGTRTRTVTCQKDGTATVADSNCTDTKPATSETCNTGICYTYSWYSSSWGSCNAACDSTGTQSRTVYCRRSDNTQVADSYCASAGTKPNTSTSCSGGACYTYSWYTGSYGSCSATKCGSSGTKSRTVYCRRSDGSSVGSGYCSGAAPSSSTSCSLSCGTTGSGQCTKYTASNAPYPSCAGHCGGESPCPSTWKHTGTAKYPGACQSGHTSNFTPGSTSFTCYGPL